MNENSGRRVGENPGRRAQISWRDSQTQRRHRESGRSDDSDGKYARLRSRSSSLVGDVVGDRECPIWTGGRRCNRRSREKSISDQNREWRFPQRKQSGTFGFLRPSAVSREALRKGEWRHVKMTMCTPFQRGHCTGQRCPFSHGEEDPRCSAASGDSGRYSSCRRYPPVGDGGRRQLPRVPNGRSRGEWTLIRDPQLKGRQQGASQRKCRNCRDHSWSSGDVPRGAVARCGETWRDDHYQVAPPLRLLRALLSERTDLIRHSQLRGGHQLHPVCRRSTLPPHLLMHKWLRWDAHQTQTGLRSKSMRRRAPVRLTHTRREGACDALGGIT